MQGSKTKHSKPLEPLEVCPVVNSISSGLIEVCAGYLTICFHYSKTVSARKMSTFP